MQPPSNRQTAAAVLMVRPACFFGNPETAADNAFQKAAAANANIPTSNPVQLQAAALREFDGVVAALAKLGVEVQVFEDAVADRTPDSIFPNNWFATHDDRLTLYPMMAPSRRRERKPPIVAWLRNRYARVIDLTAHETADRFLEGTGSLLLDHRDRVAYAGISQRTHPTVLTEWGRLAEFEIEAFPIADAHGMAIYHTNVMLSIGSGFVAIVPDAIPETEQRERVLQRLRATGRDVIELSFDQMNAFAANILEVRSRTGPVLAISTTAWECLSRDQSHRLERAAQPCIVDVATIEHHGGGGVRCMLAELF